MQAMRYELTLPADYDMGIIRHRVASRGAALDDFAGLGARAYLIRERGTQGSPVNQYIPFYLWNSLAGMNRFLRGGGGFGGILSDFGRPVVAQWTGLAYEHGPDHADAPHRTAPRTALRRLDPVPLDADPMAVISRAVDELPAKADQPGVHSVVLAVDHGTGSW